MLRAFSIINRLGLHNLTNAEATVITSSITAPIRWSTWVNFVIFPTILYTTMAVLAIAGPAKAISKTQELHEVKQRNEELQQIIDRERLRGPAQSRVPLIETGQV